MIKPRTPRTTFFNPIPQRAIPSRIDLQKSSEIDWNVWKRNGTGRLVLKHPPVKEKVLNAKERVFAREYMKDGNGQRAYMVAYPGVKLNSAGTLASKKLRSKGFSTVLERHGVTDSLLADVLKEGLGATRVQTSPTEPDSTIPDFGVRHKYLETGLKVKGHMSNIEQQTNIQVNILDYKENE